MKLNLILLIVIFSCSNNNQDMLNNKDSLKVSNSLEFNQTQLEILNFEEYWKVFGTALKANDTNKIKLLVETPLVILGHEDHDPHLKINANEIVNYVLFAVDNGGYYDMEKDTSISNRILLLSDLKTIPEYKQGLDSQWISDFVFKKTGDAWKLVTLYMDTKELKNKLK